MPLSGQTAERPGEPFLTAGSAGAAREIAPKADAPSGVAPPTAPVGVAAAGAAGTGWLGIEAPLVGPSSTDTQLQTLRLRVLLLALALAGVAVLDHVAAYIIGAAEVQAALEFMRRVAPHVMLKELGHVPGSFVSLALGAPNMLTTILLSVAVPLCGYFGAKRNDLRMLCCFSGCNCLHAVVGAIVLVGAMVLLMADFVAPEPLEPEVQLWFMEIWLQECDPTVCTKLEGAAQVDCLGGSGWRTVAYPGVRHLRPDCPMLFLNCIRELEEVARDGCYSPGQVPCPDRLRRTYCSETFRDHQQCSILSKCATNADKGACVPAGVPQNITKYCTPEVETVRAWRAAASLAPVLMPRIRHMATVKVLLFLPYVALSGIGTFWGVSLYSKVSAGYATLPEPAAPALQVSRVQPQVSSPGATEAAGGSPARIVE